MMQVTQLGINVWETGFRNSAETQHENDVIINKAGYSLLYCMYQHFVEIYMCVCVCVRRLIRRASHSLREASTLARMKTA